MLVGVRDGSARYHAGMDGVYGSSVTFQYNFRGCEIEQSPWYVKA